MPSPRCVASYTWSSSGKQPISLPRSTVRAVNDPIYSGLETVPPYCCDWGRRLVRHDAGPVSRVLSYSECATGALSGTGGECGGKRSGLGRARSRNGARAGRTIEGKSKRSGRGHHSGQSYAAGRSGGRRPHLARSRGRRLRHLEASRGEGWIFIRARMKQVERIVCLGVQDERSSSP
jgi:hypothetical protein